MMRFAKAAAATALATSLVGCGTSVGLLGANGGAFGAKSRNQAEWTFMLHLGAANNLEPFAGINLNEIEAAIDDKNVNFIVLFDGQRKGDSKIYRMTRDANGNNKVIVSPVIDDKGAVIPADTKEIDSGDVRTAARFTQWAIKNYPAKKYGYLMWDHGSGIFTPQGQRVNLAPGVDRNGIKRVLAGSGMSANGICWDDETGNHMSTAQFGDVVAAAAQAAGKPLDMVGFDACLMAHVELVYQMKGNGLNMVASEELEPGLGWDYMGWMKRLTANPSADGALTSKYLVQAYGESYKPGGNHAKDGREQEITLSAVSYAGVKNNLVPAMNALASELVASLPAEKAAIQAARRSTQEFYNSDCGDIGSFVGHLGNQTRNPRLRQAAASTQQALDSAVIAEVHNGKWTTEGTKGATGLVVFFPETKSQWKNAYNDPNQIAFAAEGWRNFLVEYLK
ncbi:MAG: clostripain-related cysteine peptidase [Candidatus Sericytochromatia bacterium]|nr:clostripain-related cysteine peptidase [Candidatus Sericytochromatia bacterium]